MQWALLALREPSPSDQVAGSSPPYQIREECIRHERGRHCSIKCVYVGSTLTLGDWRPRPSASRDFWENSRDETGPPARQKTNFAVHSYRRNCQGTN